MATTTWNSIDSVRPFLVHYRRLGFDRVLVMDFDSTDGTRDILAADEWRGFVELVPFPGIASLDSSNVMLASSRRSFGPHHWCLFCDPDELLVTPSMSIHEPALDEFLAETEALLIPRFNMTAPLSAAGFDQQGLSAVDTLTLRIDRRHTRSIAPDMGTATLDPPWIFTAIPGKVFVRLDTAISVGEGDHSARTLHGRSAVAPDGIHLLHYPFRGYSTFRAKIELARVGFASNPHLSPSHGWQVKRWITLSDIGTLRAEYLQQFIPDEDVERLLADGTLCRDESIVRFHLANTSIATEQGTGT